MINRLRKLQSSGPFLFLAVLLLATILRVHGVGFGLPALNDPDELMFELGATRMLTGPTLNPGWFGHPATTTMYVLALVNSATFATGWLLGNFANPSDFLQAIYNDPGIVILPGRLAMVVFALVTIWQTWRLGEAAGGRSAGLLAALFLACSPVHITYSQIIRSDMMGTVFMLMTISAALRIARDGRAADYRWAALYLALAVASKWPFLIAGLAVAGAAAARIRDRDGEPMVELRRLGSFLMLAPVLLLAISPYLLLAYKTVWHNLSGEARTHHLGATGGGFFDNGWWYLSGPLSSAMGLVGLAMAFAGLWLMARNRKIGWVILPVLAAHALIICLHGLRWERWVVPMLPLLSLSASLVAADLFRKIANSGGMPWAKGLVALSIVAVPLALLPTAWLSAEARDHDTRQAATRWAVEHIPPGSTVMVEHFAFDLVREPWTVLFPMGDAGCVDAKAMLAGKIDYHKVETARGDRSNVDYGTVAPARRNTCKADYMILMEMKRYHDERAQFPAEDAAYRALLHTMEIKAVIAPEPGRSAGPHMVILAAPGGRN